MRTLHAYLTRQVVASLLMTVAVFTFVLLVGNVLKEVLSLLVNRQASFAIFAQAVGLLIPFVWVFALPMGMLTATLLVFGRFSADQELTAARASGISLVSLVTPVLLLSLALCALSALVNMEIAPRCRVAYKKLSLNLGLELANLQMPEGEYIKTFPGYIFYVGKNRAGTNGVRDLKDVWVFSLKNETNRATTTYAPSGTVEVDAARRQLTLHLFNASYVSEESGRLLLGKGEEIPLVLNLASAQKPGGKPSISDMTFGQLRAEQESLEQALARPLSRGLSGQQLREQKRQIGNQLKALTSRVRFQAHQQVAFSFACFGFTLVGIPLGIRVQRRETNIGIAIALLLVAVYYSFILVGTALDAKPEKWPQLIVWAPNFLFQAVGAVLLWRANSTV